VGGTDVNDFDTAKVARKRARDY